MVDDPLPAGLEIDNPNLLQSGDVRALDWLNPAYATFSEARSDRFLAAVDWRSDKPFELAYIVRAISPGSYHHPAASVEEWSIFVVELAVAVLAAASGAEKAGEQHLLDVEKENRQQVWRWLVLGAIAVVFFEMALGGRAGEKPQPASGEAVS